MASPWYANSSPTFQPAMRLITAITQAKNAQITTSFDHDYISGTIVRIYVPKQYGMVEIDKQVGTITVTGSDTFTITIDTRNFTTFSIPAPLPAYTSSYPHVIPIGEINSILTAATKNVLPN